MRTAAGQTVLAVCPAVDGKPALVTEYGSDRPHHPGNRLWAGFGLLDAILMLPMPFSNKSVAITGAFLDRFAIGFLICVVDLPCPDGAWG